MFASNNSPEPVNYTPGAEFFRNLLGLESALERDHSGRSIPSEPDAALLKRLKGYGITLGARLHVTITAQQAT